MVSWLSQYFCTDVLKRQKNVFFVVYYRRSFICGRGGDSHEVRRGRRRKLHSRPREEGRSRGVQRHENEDLSGEKKRPEPSDHICSGCTVVHLASECRVIALIMSHWRPCFVKIWKADHFGKGIGHTTADLISTRAPSTRRYGLPVALSCACYSTFFWRPQNQPSRTNN